MPFMTRNVLALVMVLLIGTMGATAMHPNSAANAPAFTLRFDHDGDNAWWVEVLVKGEPGFSAVTVEARVEGGTYHHLQATSSADGWTKWATNAPHGQFYIPPGARVQFRAWVVEGASGTGALVESCHFTHPDGIEQCNSTFMAKFTLVTGNEWWVQTQVTPDSSHTVQAVDARIDQGPWKPLQRQSWGVRAWAASYAIPDGSVVQFRATANTGATAQSSCYQWVPPQGGGQTAAVASCNAAPFTATFRDVKGNEWWVETKVSANRPLSGVDVRIDCGPWKALWLRSWGAYAASTHVPAGSVVQLQARSGDQAILSQGYVWPMAQPTSGCSGERYQADFRPVTGNDWWAEVYVTGNRPTVALDLRRDGGTWQPMTLRSWGAWAIATDLRGAPIVEFRARASDGTYDFSYAGYSWPSAKPFPDPGEVGPTPHVEYRNLVGNANWVQVNTHSNFRIHSMVFRIDGGPWHSMSLADHGDWVRGGVHVPAGSGVQFRASEAEAGRSVLSPTFVWPPQ
jgi:hypothetical protein